MNYTLLFVVLLIALVWMILYCFYLKELVKDLNSYIRRVNTEQNQTSSCLRQLGKKLGYDLLNTDTWIKEDKS